MPIAAAPASSGEPATWRVSHPRHWWDLPAAAAGGSDRHRRGGGEATTSWAYVGPGLRIQLELLGPEYALEFSSLSTGLKIFMSRAVTGSEGEDLVEKQNAEQGLMPVLEDEAGVYGYTDENWHMVEAFRKGEKPLGTFLDGVAVVEMLMAAEDRAKWAEDRTILANERTYSGWLRTGFAAIAVGLGFHAVFGATDSVWLAKVGATLFVLMGPVVVVLAYLSACKVLDRLDSHAAEQSSRKRMIVLTTLCCLGSAILLVVLWTLDLG